MIAAQWIYSFIHHVWLGFKERHDVAYDPNEAFWQTVSPLMSYQDEDDECGGGEGCDCSTVSAVEFEIEALPGSVVLKITNDDEDIRIVMDVPVSEARRIAQTLLEAADNA